MVQDAKKSTVETSAHTSEQLIVVFFKNLGFYVAPIFLHFNFSANQVTVIGLILGMLAATLIWSGQVITGIAIYFLVYVLDFVDGTIARTRGEATFFGRFIDGFFGIIILTCMRVSLSTLFIEKTYGMIIMWLGIFSAVLTPMHHLFYDRYSTFVRWIKEEGHQIEISPYLRPKMSRITNVLFDTQNLLLFCLPLYYWNNYGPWLLTAYFLLSISLSIFTLIYYTKSASDNFKVKAKQHR